MAIPPRPNRFNPIFMMADSDCPRKFAADSSARWYARLDGETVRRIIETPITANFREGLTVLRYFISTHGARKGLADTALKTANSGYLTRRLVDIAQDVIVTEEDCGTTDGILVSALLEGGEIIQTLEERLLGRLAGEDIRDPVTGEIIVSFNEEIDEEQAKAVVEAGVDRVKDSFGADLSVRAWSLSTVLWARLVARASGRRVSRLALLLHNPSVKPGTQLTMRTFHISGTASKVVEQTVLEAKHAEPFKIT